jgi:hypothetical protein
MLADVLDSSTRSPPDFEAATRDPEPLSMRWVSWARPASAADAPIVL